MSLVVRSGDGLALCASEVVLREARVLSDLHEAEDGGEDVLLLPPMCRASEMEELFRMCAESTSTSIHSSSQCTAWASRAEMESRARVLHCAHYLDCPNVLRTLVKDFAAVLVNALSTAAAAERFYAPPWALRPSREWPEGAHAVSEWLVASMDRGNFLGTRAHVLTATWAHDESPLSSLPQELYFAILEQADAFCVQELGSPILVLRDQSSHGGHDVEAAFAKLEARRDELLNSPLAISVAVTWALAPASLPLTRSAALRALRSVCTFGNKEAFSACLDIVRPKIPAESTQTSAVEATAFKALPIVIDREDEGQVQSVVDAATTSMLHPAAEVRAAAVSCLGAVAEDPPSVFRFVARTTGLDVLLGEECELTAKSMEEALEGSLQSRDPQVRRASAESIGVLVAKRGEAVAERVVERLTGEQGALSASAPELRAAGVLAIQHLMLHLQIPSGWSTLMSNLHDPVFEVRSAVRLALLALAGIEGSHTVMMPLLQDNFDVANEAVRCMIVEIATAITHLKPSNEHSKCAGHLACKALKDSIPSVSICGLKLLCALKGPEEALLPVVFQLQSGDEEHRLEACRALAAISRGYEPKVVAAISDTLEITRPEEQVVEIASILKKLAKPRCDTIAARAFAKLVKMRSETQCIIIALKGLEAVAPKGHALARMAALAMVRNNVQDVVEAAVGCLQYICYRGDLDAVTILIDLVAGNVQHLRPIALKALGVLGLANDELVLETIRSRMDHGYWPVRAAALRAFGSLAPRGCPHSISTVQDCLSDISADVRQIAVEVLVSIAHPREREVFEFLASVREEQPLPVQISIDESLDSLLLVGVHRLEETSSSSTAYVVSVGGYNNDNVEQSALASTSLDDMEGPRSEEFEEPVESCELLGPLEPAAPLFAAEIDTEPSCIGCQDGQEFAGNETDIMQKLHVCESLVSSPTSTVSTTASTPKSRPELRASLRAFLAKADRTRISAAPSSNPQEY